MFYAISFSFKSIRGAILKICNQQDLERLKSKNEQCRIANKIIKTFIDQLNNMSFFYKKANQRSYLDFQANLRAI